MEVMVEEVRLRRLGYNMDVKDQYVRALAESLEPGGSEREYEKSQGAKVKMPDRAGRYPKSQSVPVYKLPHRIKNRQASCIYKLFESRHQAMSDERRAISKGLYTTLPIAQWP